MNTLNEDYSGQSQDYVLNSGSELVSVERRDGRSMSTISRIFSSTHLLTSRKSITTHQHALELNQGKGGKKIRELREQLETSINDSLSLPIEYLESTLFDLSHEYYKDRDWPKPVLCTFATMYPIQKLITEDSLNSDKWAMLLDQYISYNSNAFKEMKFFKKFVQFINDLSVSWDLCSIYDYRIRFSKELEFALFIDLNDLFSGFFSNEVIWMSLISNSYPLNEIFNEELKYLALLLQAEFNELFEVFIQANKANIFKCDSIQSWLSYQNPILFKEFCFSPPDKKSKPDYQKLRIRVGNSLLWRKTYRLKRQLESFEYCYRIFECSLLKTILELINYDY
jgi:hypothetical protein